MLPSIDTEGHAHRNATFRRDLRQSILHSTVRHPATKVLATAAWYAEIAYRLGAKTSYRVGKILEPEGYRENAELEPNHRSKWRKYQIGAQSPCKSFIEKINTIIPGSSRLINHELWRILDLNKLPAGHVTEEFSKINPGVSHLIYKEDLLRGIYRRKPMGTRLLRSLELNSGIDSLACVTLLFLEFFEGGQRKHFEKIANCIYCVMAITCMNPPLAAIGGELFNIYKERIFSRVEINGCGYLLDGFDFKWRVEKLIRFVAYLENNKFIRRHDWSAQTRELVYILNGFYGMEMRNALAMPFGPLQSRCEANEQYYKEMDKWNVFCNSGKKMLEEERYELIPPPNWRGWRDFDKEFERIFKNT